MKELVVTSNYFSDFRLGLIQVYKKYKEPIETEHIVIQNYKIIVDNIALDQDNCHILAREGVLSMFTRDSILDILGYSVDSTGFAHHLCSNKALLFYYLKHHGYPVPSIYVNSFPPSIWALHYSENDIIIKPEVTNEENKMSISTYVEWDKPCIQGYLIYFYLGVPLVMSAIKYMKHDSITLHNTLPEDFFKKLVIKNEGTYLTSEVKEEKVDKVEKEIVAKLGRLNPELVQKATKIPEEFKAASCEILIGNSGEGSLKVLNVSNTHTPFSEIILGEKHFLRLIEERFKEYMGLEDD